MKTALWLRRVCKTLQTIVALLTIGFGSLCAADDEQKGENSGGKASSTSQTPQVADLFEEEVLTDNVFVARQKAEQMSVAARFGYLRDWVLPSKNHSDFRLAAKQTQADPVVPLIDDHPFDIERQRGGGRARRTADSYGRQSGVARI